MPLMTLGEAARACGVPKSTIARAVRSGRLSAGRDDKGQYAIDAAELARVYEMRPEGSADTDGATRATARDATGGQGGDATPDTVAAHQLAVRLAAAEAQVSGLKDMVEELRRARDQWQQQAERATLALQKPEPPAVIPMPGPAPVATEPGTLVIRLPSWLRRRVG